MPLSIRPKITFQFTYPRVLSRVGHLQVAVVKQEVFLKPLHPGLSRLPELLVHGLLA